MSSLFKLINSEDALYNRKPFDPETSDVPFSWYDLIPSNEYSATERVMGHSLYQASSKLSQAFGAGLSELVPEQGPVKEFIEDTFIRNPYEYNIQLRAVEKGTAERIAVDFLAPIVQMGAGGFAGASAIMGGAKYAESHIIEGQSKEEALQRGIATGGMFYIGSKYSLMPKAKFIQSPVQRTVAESLMAGGLWGAVASAEAGLQEAINLEYGKEADFGKMADPATVLPSVLMGIAFRGGYNILQNKGMIAKDLDDLSPEQIADLEKLKVALNTLDADHQINIPRSDDPTQNIQNKEAFETTLQAFNEGLPVPAGTYDNVAGFVRKDPFLLTGEEFNTYVLQVDSNNFKLTRPPEYIPALANIEKQAEEYRALIANEIPESDFKALIKENEEIALAFKENEERIKKNYIDGLLEKEAIAEMEKLQVANFLKIEQQRAIQSYKRKLQKLEKQQSNILRKKEIIEEKIPDITDEDVAALMARYDDTPVDELIDDIDEIAKEYKAPHFQKEFEDYRLLGVSQKDINLADINVDIDGNPIAIDGVPLIPRPFVAGAFEQYPTVFESRPNELLSREEWEAIQYEREFDEFVEAESKPEPDITPDQQLEKISSEISAKEEQFQKIAKSTKKTESDYTLIQNIKRIGGISDTLFTDIVGESGKPQLISLKGVKSDAQREKIKAENDRRLRAYEKFNPKFKDKEGKVTTLFNKSGNEIDGLIEKLSHLGYFKEIGDRDLGGAIDNGNLLREMIVDELNGDAVYYPPESRMSKLKMEIEDLKARRDGLEQSIAEEVDPYQEYLQLENAKYVDNLMEEANKEIPLTPEGSVDLEAIGQTTEIDYLKLAYDKANYLETVLKNYGFTQKEAINIRDSYKVDLAIKRLSERQAKGYNKPHELHDDLYELMDELKTAKTAVELFGGLRGKQNEAFAANEIKRLEEKIARIEKKIDSAYGQKEVTSEKSSVDYINDTAVLSVDGTTMTGAEYKQLINKMTQDSLDEVNLLETFKNCFGV